MSDELDLHPTTPDGYCMWLDWCVRPECKHPESPEKLLELGGEIRLL